LSISFKINVGDLSVPISARLDWTTTTADLNLFLTAPGSTVAVAQATSETNRPETLSYTPTATGNYTLRVKAASGASPFTLSATYGKATTTGSALRYDTVFGFKGPGRAYVSDNNQRIYVFSVVA
jgi:hypothetical protein